eukprot:6246254-Alexandrium_andersonii.AAC.1
MWQFGFWPGRPPERASPTLPGTYECSRARARVCGRMSACVCVSACVCAFLRPRPRCASSFVLPTSKREVAPSRGRTRLV